MPVSSFSPALACVATILTTFRAVCSRRAGSLLPLPASGEREKPQLGERGPRNSTRRPGDQPGSALKREISPQPAERDDHPIAEADQIIDVGEGPDHPRDEAAQANPAEIDHRRLAPDGGE